MKSKLLFAFVSGLLLTTSCSNSNGIVINQDKNQAKAFRNYADKYVALVEPLQFQEKALKLQQLLLPDASFYDFYVDENSAVYMNVSCYVLKDGRWQHHPIATFNIEINPLNYAYLLMEEFKNNNNETVYYQIRFTTFDTALSRSYLIETKLDATQMDPLKNAVVCADIDSGIGFELNKEYILYYTLSNENGVLSSLNMRELSQFIEENNKTKMYESGFVFTISFTNIIND